MFKNITGTFITRLSVSVLNFILIILTAKFLGAEARGSISLCVLAVAIAGLVNEIVGGPAVVYLVPRFNNRKLTQYAYLWAIFSSITISVLLALFHFYDVEFIILVTACSFVLCMGTIHQFILLGHQKISSFNTTAIVQTAVTFLVFLGSVVFKVSSSNFYFYALLLGYIAGFLVSFNASFFIWQEKKTSSDNITLKMLFNNGLLTQTASFFHLMSSRITFYYSEYFISLAFVGVLSIAVSVTEAALLFSTSVALITASAVSNQNDKSQAATLTVQLIKTSWAISGLILLVLCLFPEQPMLLILGADFEGIKLLIFTLVPGAMAGSVNQIISHYYTGIGKFAVNTRAGLISMGVTGIGVLLYLATHSVLLPGLIISASAWATNLYFVRLFLQEIKQSWYCLIPSAKDFQQLVQKIIKF